jgi:hypothetical protein
MLDDRYERPVYAKLTGSSRTAHHRDAPATGRISERRREK